MKFPKLKKKSEKYCKFSVSLLVSKHKNNSGRCVFSPQYYHAENKLGSESISLPIVPRTTQVWVSLLYLWQLKYESPYCTSDSSSLSHLIVPLTTQVRVSLLYLWQLYKYESSYCTSDNSTSMSLPIVLLTTQVWVSLLYLWQL